MRLLLLFEPFAEQGGKLFYRWMLDQVHLGKFHKCFGPESGDHFGGEKRVHTLFHKRTVGFETVFRHPQDTRRLLAQPVLEINGSLFRRHLFKTRQQPRGVAVGRGAQDGRETCRNPRAGTMCNP